eukprot:TRINITY_DN4205_c0_g1_i2.p1 TRINITY_DN4205_c0_g1~~TRINITY_DN4205_c0_g1_i2.p1  ORF type:complete len:140 (+),score=44.37 TRINITY_DN4205_c0_g1_i2:73-492(+)
MTVQKTLAMIKPDAVAAEKDQEILQLIEANGFTIEQFREVEFTKELATEFYKEHEGKPFFNDLIAFVTSGPAVALILSKENAIAAWRDFIGPTNPEKARAEKPESIRAKFGTDGTKNAAHGSDSEASFERESALLFSKK